MTKTPSWEELRTAIIQCMDESEKTSGVRRASTHEIAKKFNKTRACVATWLNHSSYAEKFGIHFRNEFLTTFGPLGGVYSKSDPNAPTPSQRKNKIVSDETNVQSLVHLLDSPPEQKTTESLLFEEIRSQLAQNAQFANNILQIAARS